MGLPESSIPGFQVHLPKLFLVLKFVCPTRLPAPRTALRQPNPFYMRPSKAKPGLRPEPWRKRVGPQNRAQGAEGRQIGETPALCAAGLQVCGGTLYL
jgi:hypothetical protein